MPVAEAALRGQQAPSRTDLVLGDLSQTLAENGSIPEMEARVSNMTEVMHSVFQALPRSAEGRLDASAVRYLLHRYFIGHDGWFVQGSDSSGEAANNSLPEVVLGGGSALATALSERLAARGLSLREVAVLATALEILAGSETARRLQRAYQIVGLTHHMQHATEGELSLVLEVYMQMYVLGQNFEIVTWAEVNETWKGIHEYYPMWDELKRWAHAVRSEVLAKAPEKRGTERELAEVVEVMQSRYGRWQDQQCLSIKKSLQAHEIPGTGRIPLSKFYFVDMGNWLPMESQAYLKHLGALDDTDASKPSVVLPNYFDSPTNCVGLSKYYSVCCISECEALLGHVERELGSPGALPRQIVDIVEHLPSSTVEAPRILPAQLIKRLESVAELHGGHAPLHGRLFRQWMHHAFPDECSYPALSFTEKLLRPADFTLQTGQNATVDVAETQRQLLLRAPRKGAAGTTSSPAQFTFEVDPMATMYGGELPWSDDEEIFITCPTSGQQRGEVRSAGVPVKRISRAVFLLALAASMVFLVTRARRSAQTPLLSPHAV